MISSLYLKLAGFGVLAVILGVGTLYLHHRWYSAGRASNQAKIVALQATHQDDQSTIKQLQAAQAQMKQKCEAPTHQAETLSQAVKDQSTTRDKATASEKAKIHAGYAETDKARKWADTHVPKQVAEALK